MHSFWYAHSPPSSHVWHFCVNVILFVLLFVAYRDYSKYRCRNRCFYRLARIVMIVSLNTVMSGEWGTPDSSLLMMPKVGCLRTKHKLIIFVLTQISLIRWKLVFNRDLFTVMLIISQFPKDADKSGAMASPIRYLKDRKWPCQSVLKEIYNNNTNKPIQTK